MNRAEQHFVLVNTNELNGQDCEFRELLVKLGSSVISFIIEIFLMTSITPKSMDGLFATFTSFSSSHILDLLNPTSWTYVCL